MPPLTPPQSGWPAPAPIPRQSPPAIPRAPPPAVDPSTHRPIAQHMPTPLTRMGPYHSEYRSSPALPVSGTLQSVLPAISSAPLTFSLRYLISGDSHSVRAYSEHLALHDPLGLGFRNRAPAPNAVHQPRKPSPRTFSPKAMIASSLFHRRSPHSSSLSSGRDWQTPRPSQIPIPR
jgi:hypothetical protein